MKASVFSFALASAAPSPPRFSWDTVPVFYHSCNLTGPLTDEAIGVMAKFPMVTVEKGQGVQDATDGRSAEDKILESLRRVKALDSNISTIFYYNSVLDWPMYKLHEDFQGQPNLYLRNTDGSVCHLDGDLTFPNHSNLSVFDFTQAAARDLWMDACLNLAKTGFVDGCFSDRAGSTPCSNSGGDAYKQGHVQVHQDLQKALGNGVLIANNAEIEGVTGTMIEGFKAREDSIELLMQHVAAGKLVQARANWGTDGCQDEGFTNSLAAFLIGAGERSYYACSKGWSIQMDPVDTAWHAEYDKPLGSPQGLAVRTGDVYRREFASAAGTTVVTFDVSTNTGSISWSGTDVSVVV